SRGTSSLSRTAVADVDKQKQIQFAMYPNPVNSELNIVLPSNLDNAQVEIYNVLGKKISSKNLNDSFNKLNVSTLSTGIYLIKIIGDNNTFGVKQFVKK
ncbi:MAG TPA: T9SS type A sorting domain-containing protein, partial [Flavobacteriaceae bacterium]|nr:T9SS type A sorting domain-containing protein [Flavobacteriaceae bacterium]